jgi:hypothetical protein
LRAPGVGVPEAVTASAYCLLIHQPLDRSS